MMNPMILEINWAPDQDVLSISFDAGEVERERTYDPEVPVPNGCEAFVHAAFNAAAQFVEIEFINASSVLPQTFLQAVKKKQVDCVVKMN